jgi:hypothetical protein
LAATAGAATAKDVKPAAVCCSHARRLAEPRFARPVMGTANRETTRLVV